MNIQSLFSPNMQSRAADATASTGNTNSNQQTTPNNQLNANSFITLLSAQLQAQDPLDPMDPNQMVDELTSMNSLQQLIGIKQDLDNLGGASGTSSSSSNAAANAAVASYTQAGALNPAHQDVVIQQKLFPAQTPANS